MKTNLKNVLTMDNKELGLKVRTIQNEDGSILINAYDTAIGFGFTTVAKSGNTCVRWNRVNQYLKELGFDSSLSKDDFIPESLFYLLGMKANNKTAQNFQQWLAIDVIPSIRKDGGYISDNATKEQVQKLNNKWAKKSIYLTDEIHDRKSIRKYIRNYDMMKLDECIDTIAEMTNKMKGDIKHELLDVAIAELKKIDEGLMKDTIKHTYIKDTACAGIITLQDVKIGKYKRKLNRIIA